MKGGSSCGLSRKEELGSDGCGRRNPVTQEEEERKILTTAWLECPASEHPSFEGVNFTESLSIGLRETQSNKNRAFRGPSEFTAPALTTLLIVADPRSLLGTWHAASPVVGESSRK